MAASAAGSPDLQQIAEQRLRELLEETPIGHAALDADGVVQHANAALSAMLGVSEQALIGRSWISLLAPTDRTVVGAGLHRLGAGVAAHLEGEHALLLRTAARFPRTSSCARNPATSRPRPLTWPAPTATRPAASPR